MPTKRRRNKQDRLDHWKIDQLVIGWPMLAGTGYSAGIGRGGCGQWKEADWDEFFALMKADWERYGADFMAWWRGETEQFTAAYSELEPKRPDPSIVPWAAQVWGVPGTEMKGTGELQTRITARRR